MNFERYILKKTRKDYNLIGDKFSKTRNRPWEEFEFLFEDVEEGTRVLDLGCGNGRFFEFFKGKNVDYTGLDKSEKLILKAQEKFPEAEFVVGDGLDLPFPDNSFDYVFSIAVLHHLPSIETRIAFLKEIKRVLRESGKARLSVWNRLDGDKSIYFKNIKEKLTGKMGIRDAMIPWKNNKGEVVTERYYHFFKKRELVRLTEKAGFKVGRCLVKGKGIGSNIFIFLKNED